MSITGTPVASVSRSMSRLSAYSILVKPDVTFLVVLTTMAGFYLGASGSIDPLRMFNAIFGTTLVAAGTAALNQVIERASDAKMRRTSARPLPLGALSSMEAFTFGSGLILLGAMYLAVLTNWLACGLALLTTALYLGVYTPLKQRTTLATAVGAIPGAIPPLVGWAAARGSLNEGAWLLFAILFLWQFPHFHAISWMYREDYRRAGIRMLPVVEEDGRSTVREVLAYSMMLVPVSLFPGYLHMVGKVYIIGALIFSLAFLYYSIRFSRVLSGLAAAESRKLARGLLRVSVLYLPALFVLMMISARFTPVQ